MDETKAVTTGLITGSALGVGPCHRRSICLSGSSGDYRNRSNSCKHD